MGAEAPGRALAAIPPYGVHTGLATAIQDLYAQGRYAEALATAEWAEAVVGILGDPQSRLTARQGRMYALLALGRTGEALMLGRALAHERQSLGPRANQAKTFADVSEMLLTVGHVEDGLHWLAQATYTLEWAPHGDIRYFSALCSVGDAARAAELYELADECARAAAESFAADGLFRSASQLEHAAMLLEWGIRLSHVGQGDAGAKQLTRSIEVMRDYLAENPDVPLGRALLAIGLARTGRPTEAVTMVENDLLAMRAAGRNSEARLLHLAYGSALQVLGEEKAAYREFSAALELAEMTGQKLLIGYELAALAASMAPAAETRMMLATLQEQLRHLWRLRLDRLFALQQARHRAQLESDRERAEEMAASDALTGLANRRVFEQRIVEKHAGSVLLLIDVDKFKTINDTYSHRVGDDILRALAEVLRAQCRTGEVAIRLGGDEFAMFLDVDLAAAALVAERICRLTAQRNWDEIALGLRVTLSIGLAQRSVDMTGQDLFDWADQRLYFAKANGRNRVAA